VTPRGTIRLEVIPEVSSLDFANGLIFQGFNIPALSTRRVQTEVELESGQSFVIAGLLDNRTIESFNKVPGLGDIPLLGKIFQSKALNKNNSELLVLITPELVRPIPAGQPLPDLQRPVPFLENAPTTMPRTPGIDKTGPVPVTPANETVPVEQLMQQKAKQEAPMPANPAGQLQFVPVQLTAPQADQTQSAAPTPASRPANGNSR
jgi:pilus assembly protein CpaC